MRHMTKDQIAALSERELADIIQLIRRHGRFEEILWAKKLLTKYRRIHPQAPARKG
jgi:ParB-like chromosome segregation protein Spo0J